MKKTDTLLKEYVNKLSIETLKFLADRLYQRVGGDLGEALNVVSNNHEIDRWLASATSSDDLYDMVDTVQEYVERELSKRSPELVEWR